MNKLLLLFMFNSHLQITSFKAKTPTVNVYVGHMSYFHKPRTDGWMMHVCIILSLRLMFSMYYLNFFCKPGSDVEAETDDTCLIVSLGLDFISLGVGTDVIFLFSLFRCREIRMRVCGGYQTMRLGFPRE